MQMALHPSPIRRKIGLLLIDLQSAFVDGAWRAYLPDEEVEPIKKSFENCAKLLRSGLNNVPLLMTRCPFPGGDFELDDSLNSVVDKNQRYVIKPSTSVMDARGFREWVEEELLKQGINTLVMGGCTTTSCVRVSSVRTQKAFSHKGLQVVVDLGLCGARKTNSIQRCPSCLKVYMECGVVVDLGLCGARKTNSIQRCPSCLKVYMECGDFEPSRNRHCTCGGIDVRMASPVDKAVQCMQEEGVEVLESFDWKPYMHQSPVTQ